MTSYIRELNFLRFGYPWWECPRMNPLMIPRNNCTYLPHTLTCYTPHTTLKHTPPHTHVIYISTYTPQWKSESVSHSVMFDSLQPMDCSLPGSSVHGILQARTLEWVAIPFSRGIFLTQGSHLGLLHCWQVLYCLSHQGNLSHLRDTHIKPYAAHNKHTHTYLTQLIRTYTALAAHTHHTHHVHALPTDSPFILWDPLPLEACPVPPARGWIQRPSGGPCLTRHLSIVAVCLLQQKMDFWRLDKC